MHHRASVNIDHYHLHLRVLTKKRRFINKVDSEKQSRHGSPSCQNVKFKKSFICSLSVESRSGERRCHSSTMKKRFLSSAWFQAVLLTTVIAIASISVIGIVAFRSLNSVARIDCTARRIRKHKANEKNFQSSTVGYTFLSRFQLGSAFDDDTESTALNNDTVSNTDNNVVGKDEKVDELLALLDSVPSNLPTSKSQTDEILNAVKKIEESCPTPNESVIQELAGNWELLWTAQDRSSEQYIKGGLANRFINPLENQSYSNNPFSGKNLSLSTDNSAAGGRSNPVLPREIQDALERTGILEASGGQKTAPIRSSQGIDLRRKRVRNVVNVQIKKPFSVKGSLIVDVNFQPNAGDPRRIDVKFDSCRFIFQNANLDQKFPLGILGPRGWLRTGYIDDRIRITRGHKGSVFILSRTVKKKSAENY